MGQLSSNFLAKGASTKVKGDMASTSEIKRGRGGILAASQAQKERSGWNTTTKGEIADNNHWDEDIKIYLFFAW